MFDLSVQLVGGCSGSRWRSASGMKMILETLCETLFGHQINTQAPLFKILIADIYLVSPY